MRIKYSALTGVIAGVTVLAVSGPALADSSAITTPAPAFSSQAAAMNVNVVQAPADEADQDTARHALESHVASLLGLVDEHVGSGPRRFDPEKYGVFWYGSDISKLSSLRGKSCNDVLAAGEQLNNTFAKILEVIEEKEKTGGHLTPMDRTARAFISGEFSKSMAEFRKLAAAAKAEEK
ncbi:hypothetical protein [Streptomyces klenkii]|uniref:hypothetical protein n=1 Tax=Streptomyces klenkii TaxID=1420899 RepID=UPI0034297BA2